MTKIQIYILYAISLLSLTFYQLSVIYALKRPMALLGVITIVLILLLYLTYYKEVLFQIDMKMKVPILIMTLFVFTSFFYANHEYNQGFGASLYKSSNFFYFFFYFLLHIFTPKTKDVEKLIIIIGLIGAFFFLAQTAVYPTRIVGSKIMIARNTIRIFMPGEPFRIAAYLISLNKFFLTRKNIYIILALVFLSIAVLIGSRSTLAFHLIIPVAILIFQKKIKNRVALLGLIVLMGFIGAIVFWEIIEGMIAITEKDTSEGDDYVRFLGIQYFTHDFMTPLSFFTGNSIASEGSSYARQLDFLSMRYGYYLSDIGLVGTLVNYGAIYLSCVVYIIFKHLLMNLPVKLSYIRHYFILMVFVAIFSYSQFEGGSNAVLFSCFFYLIDRHKFNLSD